jgi:DNA-binding transcriptional LysR family regulator
MESPLAPVSTEQIAALVELARQGTLRAAADSLGISEQGVRNRLVALERRLGVELYRKGRGKHATNVLTEHGRRLLPSATQFLKQSDELADFFAAPREPEEIHVAASQYLILYVLIDAAKRFHESYPNIRIRLSSHTEREIEDLLLADADIAFGVAAPYEPSPQIEYRHLFSMDWSVIAPLGHAALRRNRLSLGDLAETPLILFERGSTGRQHVIDAFHALGLSPQIAMETTNTEIIVRMVEAGLGVSIVPLLTTGAVTEGRRVEVHSLASHIRPIRSGVLLRRGDRLSEPSEMLIQHLSEAAGALPADAKRGTTKRTRSARQR